MSDEEKAIFAQSAIETDPRRGRPPKYHRLLLVGMFWLVRPGSARRYLHDYFRKWSSVYCQFRRWTLSGVWDALLVALNKSGKGQDSGQMINSTIVRAHQHAVRAQKNVSPSRRRSWAALAVASGPRPT